MRNRHRVHKRLEQRNIQKKGDGADGKMLLDSEIHDKFKL